MTTYAITVRPPWSQIIAEAAALTALGAVPKLVENRGRPIAEKHIGTDVAIHAGRTWSTEADHDPRVLAVWRAFTDGIGCCRPTPEPRLAAIGDTRTGCVGHGPIRDSDLWIDQGAVIAVATLTDCHQADGCCQPWGDARYGADGKPAYHLTLANVRRLREPVEARGALAVPWRMPPHVADGVRNELARCPS